MNALVREVLRTISADGTVLQTRLSQSLPHALGDTLMIRRILENLVGNAVDSLAGRSGGTVAVSTESAGGDGERGKSQDHGGGYGPGHEPEGAGSGVR